MTKMRGRDSKGPPSTDLLVCFPSIPHLSMMPKPICSPARQSDSSTRHRRPSHHNLRKPSLVSWAETKHNSVDISEPTSPKVTCAGQIKVRSKPTSCKSWQSVMEEIERLHNSRKQKKRPNNWINGAFGFKKDVMQFLTCLRNIRFDFRCFGSVPDADITSDDEDDEEEEEEEEEEVDQGSSGAMLSQWFRILQEENPSIEMIRGEESSAAVDDVDATCAPPPDALLLMRSRSAPAKSWLEEREEEEGERSTQSEEYDRLDNGKKKVEETSFCEFGVEIAAKNQIQEKISRSRSWKR